MEKEVPKTDDKNKTEVPKQPGNECCDKTKQTGKECCDKTKQQGNECCDKRKQYEHDCCEKRRHQRDEVLKDFGFYNWALDPVWGGTGFDHLFHNHIESIVDNFDKQFNNTIADKESHFVRQSFSSNTVIGKDGKPVTEKFISRESTKYGKNGKQITEKNEVYNNTGDNFSRVVSEKGLGDKSLKVTKEIKDKKQTESRKLHNIEEKDVENFNQEWQKTAESEHFYHHRIGDNKKKGMLGN